MLIEVSGPSGAGKTVLAWKIMQALEADDISTVGVHERSEHPAGGLSKHVANSAEHDIRTDIFLLPWTFVFLIQNPTFVWFSIKQIVNRSGADIPRRDVLRAFLRKCGLFEYFGRRKFQTDVVVIDEGLFHCAQIYLVHPDEKPKPEVLERFAQLVPLPEQLIVIDAEVEALHKRSMEREDFYPPTYSSERRWNFADNGRQVFCALSRMKRLQPVIYRVTDANDAVVEQIVDQVGRLLSREESTSR